MTSIASYQNLVLTPEDRKALEKQGVARWPNSQRDELAERLRKAQRNRDYQRRWLEKQRQEKQALQDQIDASRESPYKNPLDPEQLGA